MTTSNRSAAFGNLLKGAINGIANYEGKTAPIIEEELGALIGVSGKTIQRYKSGSLPPIDRDQDAVRVLAEAAVRRGFVGREWLQRFLHAARYPAPQQLLDELCPLLPRRPHPERVYQNLPAPFYDQFVMREQAFAEVVDGLRQRSAAVLIVGMGGNGKTSLAREIASQCLQADAAPRFDAVVWVSDKGKEGTTNLSTVLDAIARTLDYPGFTQFNHAEKQYEVEQLLRRQAVLLIVDNAETITDGALFNWLLRLPEPSKAIITTRERHRIMWSSWLVELRGMHEDEARTLLQQRLERLRIAHLIDDFAQLEPLLLATGGNPKAITMVAGLLKYERRTLQQITDDLYAARGDLFDDLFSRAWAQLDDAARRLLMIATFFVDSASSAALSATADVTGFDFDRAMERLTDLSLLDVQQTDLIRAPRYVLHPLVRSFAGAQLAEQPEFEQVARMRWVAWYEELATQVGYCWNDLSRLNILDMEQDNILSVIDWTYQRQEHVYTIGLTSVTSYYFYMRGMWDIASALHHMRFTAAQHVGNITEEAIGYGLYVQLICKSGCLEDAEKYLPRLQELKAHTNLALDTLDYLIKAEFEYLRVSGNYDEAIAVVDSLQIVEQNLPTLYSEQKLAIAHVLYEQGNFNESWHIYEETLPIIIQLGFQHGILASKALMAAIALKQNRLEQAAELAQECYAQAIVYQDKRTLAHVQITVAQLHILRRDLAAGRAALVEAIDLLERQGRRQLLAEARAELARLEAQMAEAAE